MSNANVLAAASSRRAGPRTELHAALAHIEAYPLERTWRPAFLTPLCALPPPRRAPLADLPGERPPVAPFAGQALTIGAALAGLRTRKLSAMDILQGALAAIGRGAQGPNALLYVPPVATLRAEAEALDAELRAGVCRGLLHGIPLLAPDLLDAIGMSAGGDSHALDGAPGHIPVADAGSVRLLRAAGALFVAQPRTKGPARNGTTPPPRSRISDGDEENEASGAAAAVAKGIGLGAPALDACGSLHGAAARCGLVSFKPTFGLIPNDGAHLPAWSIDQVGCLALTVEDAALLLDVLDPASHMRYSRCLFKAPAGARIGVPPALLEGAEAGVAAALRAAAAAMRQAGAEVVEIETPTAEDFALAQAAALVLRRAEAAAYQALGGRRTQGSAPLAVKPSAEAGHVSAAHYLQAQRIREDLRWRLLRLFDRCDALLLPAGRAGADRFGSAQNSVLWSLIGFPGVALPCGWTPQRRPVGAELVAAPYEDDRLLSIAAALELALRT